MFLPAVVLLALAVVAGCWPRLDAGAEQAAVRFEATHTYAQVVLYGAQTIPQAPKIRPGSEWSGVLSGFIAAAGAVVCACWLYSPAGYRM